MAHHVLLDSWIDPPDHRRMRILVCSALLALLMACDDDAPDDRFPCGGSGGSCERGTEVCIIGGSDMCSTCVAAPESYTSNPTCDSLPPATDPDFGEFRCVDPGVCEDVEGGSIVTCDEVDWGCG
jgi:hypothetical protein